MGYGEMLIERNPDDPTFVAVGLMTYLGGSIGGFI